ncbi:metallophosphoesterase [uncultured Ruminococcus sp.]|uniref:metallophosphoesterase n=1 Tax=uncultured Ruminococcus sp. TaxID=165186 RepID=UPI002631A06E|nr:metallophosphoesterase [uncultured Ruminococcus sp.]
MILLIFIWFLIEQHLLWVHREEITLSHLPPAFDGTSLLQITDLHHREMGKNNCRIVRKAAELHPDHIVLTGDLISRDMRDFHGIASFLTALSKISPVWICVGNHELDLPPAVWEQLRQTIAQSGCRLLQNQTISLEMPGSVPLYLAGADLAYGVYRDENRKFRNLQPYTAADLENDLGRRRGCTVLLAHNPLLLDSYTGWGADLVLCGHVHGGLVRLPFLGGVLSPERRFFPKYDKGLYEKDGTKMYVSGGIGKPRLCNPPEISVIHLKSVQK